MFENDTVFSLITGNDFHGITIQSNEIIERAKSHNYPFSVKNDTYILKSPDGYNFFVINQSADGLDPVKNVMLNTVDIEKTHFYWHNLLNMKVLTKTETELVLAYDVAQAHLVFKKIGKSFRKKIAFNLFLNHSILA